MYFNFETSEFLTVMKDLWQDLKMPVLIIMGIAIGLWIAEAIIDALFGSKKEL